MRPAHSRFRARVYRCAGGWTHCADRKDYAQVLKLLDFNLDFARRKTPQQSPAAVARARRAAYLAASRLPGYAPVYRIWVGSRYMTVRLAYPRVNEYFDGTLLQVLRTAFELYQRDDITSDLINHFRRQAAAAPTPADAVYPRLSLAAILWWSDQRDEAIAELAKVVGQSRPESDLRLDLADLLLQQGLPAEAIESLEAVQPLDNLSLKRREELAITAAIAAGNAERARHRGRAALRPAAGYGNTDPALGPDAPAWSARAGRRPAGPSPPPRRRAGSALVDLMGQFQRQGKLEQAAQIATQLLRALPRSSLLQAPTRAALDQESARPAAMRILAASGRLPQLIARAKEQLAKTPNLVALHETLADYYTAARQSELAAAEMGRIAELRPDDAELRIRLALQLAGSGDHARALDHYKAAFEKNPGISANWFVDVLLAFERRQDRRSGRLHEFGGCEGTFAHGQLLHRPPDGHRSGGSQDERAGQILVQESLGRVPGIPLRAR